MKIENYKAGKQIFRRKLRRRDVSRDCGTDGCPVYSAGAGMSPATAGRTAVRFILLVQGCPKCADVVSKMFNRCAQRHSNVSESGKREVRSHRESEWKPESQNTAPEERHINSRSRLSRMEGCAPSQPGSGNGYHRGQPSKADVQNEVIGCPKCPKWESQNESRKVRIQLQRSDILIAGVGCPKWFCCSAVRVGQGIASGSATPEMFCIGVSRLSKMFVNIENHYAQRHSKASE